MQRLSASCLAAALLVAGASQAMAPKGSLMEGNKSAIAQDNDKQRQWTYKDKSLYFWRKDQKPGDISESGFNQVWYVAH